MRFESCRRVLVAAALATVSLVARAEPQLQSVNPSYAFGEPVRLQLSNNHFPIYIPGTRYTRHGTSIDVQYEYTTDQFGPWRGDFALPGPLDLGELPPGDYHARAELLQLDATTAMDRTYASVAFTVKTPSEPGVYTVPRNPDAGSPTQVVLVAATPIDPASLKVAVGEGIVRVDFRFAPYAISTKWVALANLPVLPAGTYRFEAWGTPQAGGDAEKYFSSSIVVQPVVTVTEYYHDDLDHYFITASSEDVALLDGGAYGGWKRTSQHFKAWAGAQVASGARAVCRFYAEAHRGHLYTIDPSECDRLKSLEKQGRAEASAKKVAYLGYQYEGIAFHAYPSADGTCPKPLQPVHRFSRTDAKSGAVDFRFTAAAEPYFAMMATWTHEGVAFCSPS